MVAPLPVREFTSAADMQAFYAALSARLWSPHIKATMKAAKSDRRFVALTHEQIGWMRAARAEGACIKHIARRFKRDPATVKKYVSDVPAPEGGFWLGGHKPRLPKAKALRMRRAGFTYREICADLGISYWSAWNLINPGSRDRRRPHGAVSDLLGVVSKITNVGIGDLIRAPGRAGRTAPEVARARHLLFWIIRRDRSDISLPKMGKHLGGFDHTSCMYGIWRVKAVVLHHGIDGSLPAPAVARLIWDADWSGVSFKRRAS